MRALVTALLATLGLLAQVPKDTEVQERRLANGVRLLLVERRGLTAFHATLAFRGGRVEEPAALAGATDLLARALYGATWPEDLAMGPGAEDLEGLLTQEEGLLESLRLERQRQRHAPTRDEQATALAARLASVQAALRDRFSASPMADRYLAKGGRQSAEATADGLLVQTDLPLEHFPLWCQCEAQRLQVLRLSRFAQSRAAWVASLRTRGTRGEDLLRGTALSGHPYGRNLVEHLPILEALRRSDLRLQARRTLRPDRLTIVLVGPLSLEQVLPLLDRTLGALPAPADAEAALLPEVPADLGDRRVQASLGSGTRLLTGWRIPPRTHPDHLALRLAAQLLGGGAHGRLQARLLDDPALASQVEVSLDDPGGWFPGLLVVSAQPAPGRTPAELEGALHGEVLRLQQEPIPQEGWQRALALLEAQYLATVDVPADYARALGQAWLEGGDGHLVDQEARRLRRLTPEAVQAAVRRWLRPTHRTTVVLEPGAEASLDPLETEISRVLTALAARRIDDLAQREHLVAEGLRQLRMLSAEERLRTLKLLAAQLPAEKP